MVGEAGSYLEADCRALDVMMGYWVLTKTNLTATSSSWRKAEGIWMLRCTEK